MSSQPKTRVIAIANQKGGVGKKPQPQSTLPAALAEAGLKTLLIRHLTRKGNASTGLGIEGSTRRHTTYDLIFGDVPAAEIMRQIGESPLWVVPATTDLSSADIELMSRARRTYLLQERAAPTGDHLGRF